MDFTNILIIALVCAGIGYFAGLMISNMRREAVEVKPEPQTPEVPPLPDLSYLNVARFVRVVPNGPLILEVDGQYYKSADELTPELHSRLEELGIELQGWLGLTPDGFHVEPRAASVHEAAVLEPEPVMSHPAGEVFAEPVRKTGNTGPLPYAPAFQAEEPKKRVPLSIVEQIDAILQENMIGTEFIDRGIRLVEMPNQGVAVRVGLEQYPIDAVPDEGVRALIHTAVAEWELQAK